MSGRDWKAMFKGIQDKDLELVKPVWIADELTILKGVTIGDNVVVGGVLFLVSLKNKNETYC